MKGKYLFTDKQLPNLAIKYNLDDYNFDTYNLLSFSSHGNKLLLTIISDNDLSEIGILLDDYSNITEVVHFLQDIMNIKNNFKTYKLNSDIKVSIFCPEDTKVPSLIRMLQCFEPTLASKYMQEKDIAQKLKILTEGNIHIIEERNV